MANFRDDDAHNNGYNSDGKIGPFYDVLEEEGEQDYDKDDAIAERCYNDVETNMSNGTDGNKLSEPIPILRTKCSTFKHTGCSFCQAGMSTNDYCTVECDNGQRTLDGKRVCGAAFCIFCKEKWNIGQDGLYLCYLL